MSVSAGQVTGLVKDRAVAKDLAALAKQLEHLDATPQQVSVNMVSTCVYLHALIKS